MDNDLSHQPVEGGFFQDLVERMRGAPGKRALTDRLQRGAGAPAPGAELARSTPAAGDEPVADPFDFSYAREVEGAQQPADAVGGATDQGVEAEILALLESGERDVNRITDRVFWRLHPELAGRKLAAGSPEAAEWRWLRDSFVVHAVASAQPAKSEPAPQAPAAPAPVSQAPPVSQPPAAPAPASHTPDAAPAGADGGYRTQNDNLYLPGGTCNMTSLTMGLLSFAGGDEAVVRTKVADALRAIGKPLGSIAIGGAQEDLRRALDTPNLLARVQVEDLLTTLALLRGLAVTNPRTILEVAKLTGLVVGGRAGITGNLSDAAVRTRARDAVARGERMVLGVQGGPGHFIYLVEMRSDGLIAHDPAGARLELEAPYFLSTGARSQHLLGRWMRQLARPGWDEAARRRLAHSPDALDVVERLIEARSAGSREQKATLAELATGDTLALGASNFYSLADISHYRMDIRVEMQGAESASS